MAMPGPMGSGNTPVDMMTGEPVLAAKRKERIDRENEVVEKGVSLRNEMAGEDGRLLVNFILDKLEMRLHQFMQTDPECSTLLKLLTDLNYTANIGRRRALNRIHEIMGDDSPSWLHTVK